MDIQPLNKPQQSPGRRHKAAVALKARWRFIDRVHHRKLTGAEQSDLARFLTKSWSVLAKQIKCILRLVRAFFNDAPRDDEHKQLQKRCSKYSQKALLFAITTFVAYLGSSSASSSTGNPAFKVAMAAFFVAIPLDLISATRTPKWGGALIYLSWFLLTLQSYLLWSRSIRTTFTPSSSSCCSLGLY